MTLFCPMKNPSLSEIVSNVRLRSLNTSCCFAIASSHFLLPTNVLAHSVITYPFRPRCMNVIANPFLFWALLPFVDVKEGNGKMEVEAARMFPDAEVRVEGALLLVVPLESFEKELRFIMA